MNQYYSEELSQKVKRGMHETRLKGLYQGGGLPYGYKVDGRKIVIDENTSQVVKYMYDQYSKGAFVREIIDELTKKGILYKGKPFAKNTVYNILKNERYSGVYKHGEEIVDNMYPQMIPTETYNLVRAKVEKNKFGKRSVQAVYLLRGKVKCGYCGRPISAETGTARNGEVKRYYKCIGRKKDNNGCTKTQIRKEFLEEFILNAVIDEMSKSDNIDFIVSTLMQMQEKQITNQALSVLLKEKTKVDNALENLVNAIENGIVSNTTNKRLHTLEQQQETLEREILIERSKQSIKIPESVMRTFYSEALKLEPKMLIEFLVKEIILFDDKVKIIFNNPMRSLDESQGFSLCTFSSNLHYIKQNVPILQNHKMLIEMYVG